MIVLLLVKGGEIGEVRPVTIGLVAHVIANTVIINERKWEVNSSNSTWPMDDVYLEKNPRYPVDMWTY